MPQSKLLFPHTFIYDQYIPSVKLLKKTSIKSLSLSNFFLHSPTPLRPLTAPLVGSQEVERDMEG